VFAQQPLDELAAPDEPPVEILDLVHFLVFVGIHMVFAGFLIPGWVSLTAAENLAAVSSKIKDFLFVL
jgi:hypothetical protein